MNVREREEIKSANPRSSDLKPTDSDSKIEFGGGQSGVNIPGGLREPDPVRRIPKGKYVEGYGTTESENTLRRSSTRVGADKDIEFSGEQSGGVEIPSGLREPGQEPAQDRE